MEVGDKVFVIAPNDQFTVIHCFLLFNYLIFNRLLRVPRSKSDESGYIALPNQGFYMWTSAENEKWKNGTLENTDEREGPRQWWKETATRWVKEGGQERAGGLRLKYQWSKRTDRAGTYTNTSFFKIKKQKVVLERWVFFLRWQSWRNERARVQELEWGLMAWFLSDKIIFMLNVELDLDDNLFSLI